MVPGVVAAGGISFLPAIGGYHPWSVHVLSGPQAGLSISQGAGFKIQNRVVSGHAFEALRIPTLAGWLFDERDSAAAPGRAIVSANLARAAFPDMPFTDVIGQTTGTKCRPTGVIGSGDDVIDSRKPISWSTVRTRNLPAIGTGC